MEDSYKFAVVTDVHGALEPLSYITQNIAESDVDQVLSLGDLSPYPNLVQDFAEKTGMRDYKQIVANIDYLALVELAKTGKPVLNLAGSHEPTFFSLLDEKVRKDYNNIESHLDVRSPLRKEVGNIELELYAGSGVIFAGGPVDCHGGFATDYNFEDVRNGSNKILLTHDPIKCETPNGIDLSNYTYIPCQGLIRAPNNAGHQNIRDYVIQTGIPVTLSGHIHEAGGKAIDISDKTEKILKQEVRHKRLNLNPGPLLPSARHGSEELKSTYAELEVFSEPGEITGAKYKIIQVQ